MTSMSASIMMDSMTCDVNYLLFSCSHDNVQIMGHRPSVFPEHHDENRSDEAQRTHGLPEKVQTRSVLDFSYIRRIKVILRTLGRTFPIQSASFMPGSVWDIYNILKQKSHPEIMLTVTFSLCVHSVNFIDDSPMTTFPRNYVPKHIARGVVLNVKRPLKKPSISSQKGEYLPPIIGYHCSKTLVCLCTFIWERDLLAAC